MAVKTKTEKIKNLMQPVKPAFTKSYRFPIFIASDSVCLLTLRALQMFVLLLLEMSVQ